MIRSMCRGFESRSGRNFFIAIFDRKVTSTISYGQNMLKYLLITGQSFRIAQKVVPTKNQNTKNPSTPAGQSRVPRFHTCTYRRMRLAITYSMQLNRLIAEKTADWRFFSPFSSFHIYFYRHYRIGQAFHVPAISR